MQRLVLLVVLALVGSCSAADTLQATVYKANNAWSVEWGKQDPTGVAWGTFEDTLNVTGWGVLNIQTNAAFADADQMYGAGYLEGVLTAQRINEFTINMMQFTLGGQAPSDALLQWFSDQDQFVQQQIQVQPKDPVWQMISFVRSQTVGLVDGYTASCGAACPMPPDQAIMFANAVGDMFEISQVVDPSKRIKWDELAPHEVERILYKSGHCSAIIKVTGDYSSLFAAHSAWFTYSAMNRIFKNYKFNLNAAFVAAHAMSFSSYPGMLVSLDDFYIMDSGLVMIQTTNSIMTDELFKKIKPQSLLAWQRVRAANALARGGAEWVDIIRVHNSGTYNNQYMIVDYNKFQPGKPLPADTLWVCEQIPGLVEGADLTPELATGYFPSYNVPYFPTIFNMSGYPALVEKYGYDYSYELAPRATIFRRDQANVVDLASLQTLMRQNNYKTDPYAKGNPSRAICSRGDLNGGSDFGGCYDTKVTSDVLRKTLSSFAINGPTTSNGQLPAFAWHDATQVHVGQPPVFDFDFVPMTPKWNTTVDVVDM